jgi:hypothetical protein
MAQLQLPVCALHLPVMKQCLPKTSGREGDFAVLNTSVRILCLARGFSSFNMFGPLMSSVQDLLHVDVEELTGGYITEPIALTLLVGIVSYIVIKLITERNNKVFPIFPARNRNLIDLIPRVGTSVLLCGSFSFLRVL